MEFHTKAHLILSKYVLQYSDIFQVAGLIHVSPNTTYWEVWLLFLYGYK